MYWQDKGKLINFHSFTFISEKKKVQFYYESFLYVLITSAEVNRKIWWAWDHGAWRSQ